MKVDPNQKLLDLDPNLFKQLEDSLRRDDGWRKIADTLKEFGCVPLSYLYSKEANLINLQTFTWA